MLDIIGILMDDAAHGTLYALPAAVLAGIVSSAGPCVASRCIALAALCAGRARRTVTVNTACFVGGIVLVYTSFGTVMSAAARLLTVSGLAYAVLATFLALAGIRMLWNGPLCCEPRSAMPSRGGSALSGMALSLVPSACCTPIVLAILPLTAGKENALYGAALLACFAIGHCVPVCAFMLGAHRWERVLQRHARAAGMLGGSITLAMSGYYAILV